jgi:outer membrane protein OmpA-like peptidoglycan-associated protein
MSRRTDQPAKYDTPIKVRIWGGRGYCDTKELLAETALIDHTFWKQYNFRFEPKMSHSFITIEAFYKTPTPIPYNGNVLIDDASTIIEVPKDSEPEPAIVDLEQPEEVDVVVNISPSKANPPVKPKEKREPKTEVTKDNPDPPIAYKNEEKVLKLDRAKMTEGQVIRIENLYFKADSTNIALEAYPVLDEIYTFLKSNTDISIEVGGHTNNRCASSFCNKLSEKRAKAVTEYLTDKGINGRRLLFKGYGKRNPVATNATVDGRKRNQRVEIKILNLDG